MSTRPFPARSPAEKVSGLVYFGRMLDKIRADARGELPNDWVPNLGKGFDGKCVRFLGIDYDALRARVLEQEATDEEILQWALEHGKDRSAEEIEEFMREALIEAGLGRVVPSYEGTPTA